MYTFTGLAFLIPTFAAFFKLHTEGMKETRDGAEKVKTMFLIWQMLCYAPLAIRF